MTGTSGPLGRSSLSFRDKMTKYHAEIERLVYAAEVLCPNGMEVEVCKACIFKAPKSSEWICWLGALREVLGDHVEQHDPTEGQ